MWYSESNNNLDHSKPIIAVSKISNRKQLLLPQISINSYTIIGYNWFDIIQGEYVSARLFPTVKEALESRLKDYSFYNTNLAEL